MLSPKREPPLQENVVTVDCNRGGKGSHLRSVSMETEIEKSTGQDLGGFLQKGHWTSLSYRYLDLSFVNLVKDSDSLIILC